MKERVHIHLPFEDLKENIELIALHRLNVEILFTGDDLDNYSFETLIEPQKFLDENGLRVSFHAPFMDLSPGGVDKMVREITIKRMKQLSELAEYFKPSVVVVHPGYDDWRYGEHVDEWLSESTKTWKMVVDSFMSDETVIAVENIFEKRPDTLIRLIESVNSPRFRYCMDTGHFNMFSEVSLEEWFEKLGRYIAEIHLHDNYGVHDEHLGIGEGNFDFPLFFDLLKANGSSPLFTIEGENKEEVIKSLKFLKVL
jgi:sugar phosphate isomerase/epimerase